MNTYRDLNATTDTTTTTITKDSYCDDTVAVGCGTCLIHWEASLPSHMECPQCGTDDIKPADEVDVDEVLPEPTTVRTVDTIINELGWRLAKTKAAGVQWAKAVQECGMTAYVSDGVIGVTAHFNGNDMEAYRATQSNVRSLVGRCPKTQSGSTWGDDGVGGDIAMRAGCLTIKTSGVSKNFAAGVRSVIG